MKILKCIYSDMNLTFLKIYLSKAETFATYYITDDTGKYEQYWNWRFEDITREYKLKQLL